jgi:hypothetical protein
MMKINLMYSSLYISLLVGDIALKKGNKNCLNISVINKTNTARMEGDCCDAKLYKLFEGHWSLKWKI